MWQSYLRLWEVNYQPLAFSLPLSEQAEVSLQPKPAVALEPCFTVDNVRGGGGERHYQKNIGNDGSVFRLAAPDTSNGAAAKAVRRSEP